MKMKRYQDCLKELEDVLYKLDKTNIKALYRKLQVFEILGKTTEAMQVIKFYESLSNKTEKEDKLFNVLKAKILKRIQEDQVKTQALAKQMLQDGGGKGTEAKKETEPPKVQPEQKSEKAESALASKEIATLKDDLKFVEHQLKSSKEEQSKHLERVLK